MPDSRKPVRLFIAYSDKDDAIYKELESYLELLKSQGQIDGWYGRRLLGLDWDKVIHPELEQSNIILLLTSPGFVAHEYCYGVEVKKAVELHKTNRAHLIPILAGYASLIDTYFENLKVLPSNKKPIGSREWKTNEDFFKHIVKGIVKAVKIIQETTDDCYMTQKKRAFPFCIKQFDIKNFLCIRDTGLDKIPVDCRWVFITGENGDGKTALLQALAVGLLGNDDKEANRLLKDDNTYIRIQYKQDGEETIREIRKENNEWKSNTTDIDNSVKENILGYGVTRLNIMTREAEMVNNDKKAALSLYNETEGNFRNIETWLKDEFVKKERRETPLIRNVKETLKNLMPNIKKVEIKSKDIVYHEKGYKARYMEVSSGSKMIIAMIGDMIKRFFYAQPQAREITEFKGIVLIDELDLHLHPLWQREIPGLLSDTFPNVQFWATTHSIVPFMGAPDNSIFLKVTRKEDVLTKVERLDIDVKRLLPDTLISSPLFGLEDFISKDVNDFRTEYLYSEYEKNKNIEERLEELASKFKLQKSGDDAGDKK